MSLKVTANAVTSLDILSPWLLLWSMLSRFILHKYGGQTTWLEWKTGNVHMLMIYQIYYPLSGFLDSEDCMKWNNNPYYPEYFFWKME